MLQRVDTQTQSVYCQMLYKCHKHHWEMYVPKSEMLTTASIWHSNWGTFIIYQRHSRQQTFVLSYELTRHMVWRPRITSHRSCWSEVWLVYWCLTAVSAQTGYIVPQDYEIYHVGAEDHTVHTQHTAKQRYNTLNQHTHKLSSAWTLWIGSPRHD